LGQTSFEFANAGKVFVELLAIVGSERRMQTFGLIANGVDHALAVL
jgi:hypothetical protein